MNSRLELGRFGGVPIYLDMMFVLILIVFGYPYFASGDRQQFSIGIIVLVGVLASILLHEIGHMVVARLWKVHTAEIEISGLGGIARFAGSLPKAALPRVLIYLAGPAVNYLLYQGFTVLAQVSWDQSKLMLGYALANLALTNWWFMVFNLLPAFPLDGGRALEALIGPLVGYAWSIRIVAVLGLLVTAGVIWMAIGSLPSGIWLLLIALMLFQTNWAALDSVGGLTGRR
ncbi:MAG: hypothetical protein JSS20_02820 [Proteobacteria bacterium]|nr:hypothetical protein [Pseudomonadota bacterium]